MTTIGRLLLLAIAAQVAFMAVSPDADAKTVKPQPSFD